VGGYEHLVRIVCSHKGHPSREIAEAFLRPDNEDLLANLLENHGEVGGRELYDAMRVGLSYGRLPNAGRGNAHVPRTSVRVVSSMVGDPDPSVWDTWMLRCPTCQIDVDLNGRQVLQLILDLRASGKSLVELYLLSPDDGAAV
jgi:hypothetical protein